MMRKCLIIISLIVTASCVWSITSYFLVSNPGEIVTLSPDNLEVKKKPIDPGGLVLPHSDSLVYNRLKSYFRHKIDASLTPIPEEPLSITEKEGVLPSASTTDPVDQILQTLNKLENEHTSPQIDNKLPIIHNISNHDKVKAITTKANLNVITVSGDRYKIIEQDTSDKQDKTYKIQLSSAYSLSDAMKKWHYIVGKNRQIIGNAPLVLRKVEDKNHRIHFFIMAGGYPSAAQAKLICNKLSKKRQYCIVTQ